MNVLTADPSQVTHDHTVSWWHTRGLAVTSAAVCAAYYLASVLGYRILFPSSPFSIVWPPNTVLLVALLLSPRRRWPWLLLLTFPVHVLVQAQFGTPLSTASLNYVYDCILVLVTAAALRRFGLGDLALVDLRKALAFIAVTTIAVALSSLVESPLFVRLFLGGGDPLKWWTLAFLSNLLPFLIATPGLVIGLSRGTALIREESRGRYFEFALLAFGLACAAGLIVLVPEGAVISTALFYAPLPFLLWAAVRFGPAGLSFSFVIFALTAILSSVGGYGPFIAPSVGDKVLELQIFLLALYVPLLVLAAVVEERRTKEEALKASEARIREAELRYRTVADFTCDWEYWRQPDGSFAYMSPSCLATTGYDAQEFYRRPSLISELIFDEDREAWEAHLRESLSGVRPAGLEFRIRDKAGAAHWIDHVCTRVTGDGGEFLGVRCSNRDISRRKQSELELADALTEVGRLRDQLEADNTYLLQQLEPEQGFQGVFGTSHPMRYVFSKARQVASTSSTVLLLGETGVGKDVIARAIHNLSARHDRPLIKLNCAALPPSLVESELFGHERGAFTGAVTLRKGRFEIANGCTLFLDEIGELPMDLQAKLLRVIQDGEFERVGGTATLKTDVRLIAATNRQLDEEVKAGRFRSDLWYRLNVFPITVPPLRQRREDIPILVHHFVEKHCRRMGKPAPVVARAVMHELRNQDWPGNVRELESAVERAVITSTGSILRLEPNASRVLVGIRETHRESVGPLNRLEREHIVAALDQTLWRLEGAGGAAERLGMNPSTLRSRMRKHGIHRPAGRLSGFPD